MADADIMNLIAQQQAPAGMSMTPGGAPTDVQPPMPSPMATPEPKMGTREGAMINISMAMDLIEQALPALGSESPEGQKALSVLRQMSGILGGKKEKTKELQGAEIMQMLQNLPQAGGATPEGKAMAAAPAIPGMMPGGAPQPPAM